MNLNSCNVGTGTGALQERLHVLTTSDGFSAFMNQKDLGQEIVEAQLAGFLPELVEIEKVFCRTVAEGERGLSHALETMQEMEELFTPYAKHIFEIFQENVIECVGQLHSETCIKIDAPCWVFMDGFPKKFLFSFKSGGIAQPMLANFMKVDKAKFGRMEQSSVCLDTIVRLVSWMEVQHE